MEMCGIQYLPWMAYHYQLTSAGLFTFSVNQTSGDIKKIRNCIPDFIGMKNILLSYLAGDEAAKFSRKEIENYTDRTQGSSLVQNSTIGVRTFSCRRECLTAETSLYPGSISWLPINFICGAFAKQAKHTWDIGQLDIRLFSTVSHCFTGRIWRNVARSKKEMSAPWRIKSKNLHDNFCH